MKTIYKGGLLMAIMAMLSGCGPKIEDYAENTPKMSIQEFFTGDIKAWGIVQDWRGKVSRRFHVDMKGSWVGDEGTLEESFAYDDGKTQKRVWKIKKMPDGSYEGRADDIIGVATGSNMGNAAQWNYVMDLPVGDTTYHVRFDDWMWQMDEKTLMNRSYLKKFGVGVAELTIFMQKQ